jgi:predicted transcriptional regulator of viral defense system
VAQTVETKVLDLAKERGVLRPRDLAQADLPADYLWRLYRKEKLERVGRGLYALPGADLTEHHTLAEAALRVPHGAVCLLPALCPPLP